MSLQIDWKTRRMDELGGSDPPAGDGMIEIKARIMVDGVEAGSSDGFYLQTVDPVSSGAFFGYWDMEQWTCKIYEELVTPGRKRFREPLPRLLECFVGILFIRLIALSPAFRGVGIGRQVFQHWLDRWRSNNLGAVLVHAQPLQHRPGAYDEHGDEIRDLPWDGAEEDGERLAQHLRGWGLHRIAGTRFMVAAPDALGIEFDEDEFNDLFGSGGGDDDVPF